MPGIIFLSSILIVIFAAAISAAPTHGHAIVPAADQCDWTGRSVSDDTFFKYLYLIWSNSTAFYFIIP